MNSNDFYTELTRYYRTDAVKEVVRIKYISRWMSRNKIEYSEEVLDRIFGVCDYMPKITELTKIFNGVKVNVLGPINGGEE